MLHLLFNYNYIHTVIIQTFSFPHTAGSEKCGKETNQTVEKVFVCCCCFSLLLFFFLFSGWGWGGGGHGGDNREAKHEQNTLVQLSCTL